MFTGVDLQDQLLEPENRDSPLAQGGERGEQFLREFAGVVGSRWPSLATVLSFTTEEIEEVKRDITGSLADQALHILRKWMEKVPGSTCGTLRDKLMTVSFDETLNSYWYT